MFIEKVIPAYWLASFRNKVFDCLTYDDFSPPPVQMVRLTKKMKTPDLLLQKTPYFSFSPHPPSPYCSLSFDRRFVANNLHHCVVCTLRCTQHGYCDKEHDAWGGRSFNCVMLFYFKKCSLRPQLSYLKPQQAWKSAVLDLGDCHQWRYSIFEMHISGLALSWMLRGSSWTPHNTGSIATAPVRLARHCCLSQVCWDQWTGGACGRLSDVEKFLTSVAFVVCFIPYISPNICDHVW